MTDHDDPEGPGKRDAQRREIIEAYERLAHQSHFETLGVAESATELELKQAFFQKAKKFHPDQYRDPGFADLTDRIEALFMRVGAAYEVLRDPQSRQSYEAVLRRRRGADAPTSASMDALRPADNLIDTTKMAEDAIHRAERLIADTKTWDAIQLLQAVIPRILDRKQRDRARVLLAKAYIKNPKWLRRGEELLQTVIVEDPQNAEAHFALGMLYKESGMTSRAVGMFKKALELRPDHKQVHAELDALSADALVRRDLESLTGLTARALRAFQSLVDDLAAQEREDILAVIKRGQEARLHQVVASLEEMGRVVRQLDEVGLKILRQLATDCHRLSHVLQGKLTPGEGQQVHLALHRVDGLRHGGTSDELLVYIGEMRGIRAWLEGLRPN